MLALSRRDIGRRRRAAKCSPHAKQPAVINAAEPMLSGG
jgi:hypothetical protein